MEMLSSTDDFYTSVLKSLEEIDPNYKKYHGMIAVGSHSPKQIDDKLEKIQFVRENKIPFLGICMGMQLAIIEFARNVLNIKDATTQEISNEGTFVISKLDKLRVGVYPVEWQGKSTLESHWHNYGVNTMYLNDLRNNGFMFSYTGGIIEILRLVNHPYYMLVQFHPEYQNSKDNPHPILKEFLEVCKKHSAAMHLL